MNLARMLSANLILFMCWSSAATGHASEPGALLTPENASGTPSAAKPSEEKATRLTIRLVDSDTDAPLHGVVRVVQNSDGRQIKLPELIERENGWYTTVPVVSVDVPATRLTIEAIRGLQTERARVEVDATDTEDVTVTLRLKQFCDAAKRGWRNGNTHLHIMKRTREEAERYLREVPESDGLELVYLSHLRRIPDEESYVSNGIVQQGLTGDTLGQLSDGEVLFRPGEEHRHNFGRGGEGFGHVMLLDIVKLIRPVSIGPGIMRSGTDGIALQRGIREARSDGAAVIWCHNANGFEDIPNWVSGTLDAQNIFDGGNRGSYKDSFYRYLNIGLRIPFSTGTDWFIDDFSRVYVPLQGKLTSEAWLKQLKAGRTFITNGPLLEFSVDHHDIGDSLQLPEAKEVRVTAKAAGRADFHSIELIRNGDVIGAVNATPDGGHYKAALDETVLLNEPCWLAIRTPIKGLNNEFGQPIYAHTSPIYVDFQERRPFRTEVALALIGDIEDSLQTIREKATFANNAELQSVMEVYRNGIQILRRNIREHSR
ncbi:MAG: CehA/McbA family metallohydrolase [Fuerstiella sp.]|nr:CehA/McbA family metallohydrolase [Fuerstiella sp.]